MKKENKIKDLQYNFCNFKQFAGINKDKIFRMWFNEHIDDYCNYIYITGTIDIPNDIMILWQEVDESKENNMYPSVSFSKLSEITLAYYEDDQIEEGE